MQEEVDFNIHDTITLFKKEFSKGIANCEGTIEYNWQDKEIVIEAGIKIEKDAQYLRGGIRIKIIINNTSYRIIKIVQVLRLFAQNLFKSIRDIINELLDCLIGLNEIGNI